MKKVKILSLIVAFYMMVLTFAVIPAFVAAVPATGIDATTLIKYPMGNTAIFDSYAFFYCFSLTSVYF